LGNGAQGKVFLARPGSGPHPLVAIKEAVVREKSTDEIKAMKAVKGTKGIIQIIDDFIANGKQYIVMELVGKSISAVVKTRKDLSVATVGSIGIQLIDRLEALHKTGYVHQDLNNGNIALDQHGQLVLIDLGQAVKWTQPKSKSRRDEIGKFALMIVHLLNRSVTSLSDPNACSGMPAPVTELVKYASSSFETPDYNKIRTLLQQLVPQYTGSLIF
jgi:serine/threonine protein kinase